MDLKTYRSNSMAGALAEVKKDLGPDAVILRTRNYKAGGVMGFGGNTVVEITAARDAPIPAGGPPRRPGQPFDADAIERMRSAVIGSRTTGFAAQRGVDPAQGQEPDPLATQVGLPEGDAPAKPRMPATRVEFRPADDSSHAALETELASIRQLVGDVLRTTRKTAISVEGAGAFAPSVVTPNDPLYALYGTLCDNDVPSDIADDIVGTVRGELDPSEARDPSVVREAALRAIASRIPTAEPKPDQDGPMVQTLIGSTGVGKTTTIAKLAASYKLRHGKSVGLITADTYRIAAVDQLRTYAGIIGLPLEVVLSPADIPAAMERQRGCDIILVDTPGRSPSDSTRLDELAAVLDAVGPASKHLVLSAGSSAAVLRSAARSFGAMRPDALIVSKIDEAGALGVLLEIARLTDLPLSYLTTGQEVPDDIEHARADRLARAVLEGGLPA